MFAPFVSGLDVATRSAAPSPSRGVVADRLHVSLRGRAATTDPGPRRVTADQPPNVRKARMNINEIADRLTNRTASIWTVEIELQVQRLNDAGIPATVAQIEQQLGHPIAEASRDQLRGVIAGLNAVNRADGRHALPASR